MRPIPSKLRKHLDTLPRMHQCARRSEGDCQGRITWEHPWDYVGRQINEEWAIIGLCAYHHDVDQFQDGGHMMKWLNQYISLLLATPEDLAKYPNRKWAQIKIYLQNKYASWQTSISREGSEQSWPVPIETYNPKRA